MVRGTNEKTNGLLKQHLPKLDEAATECFAGIRRSAAVDAGYHCQRIRAVDPLRRLDINRMGKQLAMRGVTDVWRPLKLPKDRLVANGARFFSPRQPTSSDAAGFFDFYRELFIKHGLHLGRSGHSVFLISAIFTCYQSSAIFFALSASIYCSVSWSLAEPYLPKNPDRPIFVRFDPR